MVTEDGTKVEDTAGKVADESGDPEVVDVTRTDEMAAAGTMVQHAAVGGRQGALGRCGIEVVLASQSRHILHQNGKASSLSRCLVEGARHRTFLPTVRFTLQLFPFI